MLKRLLDGLRQLHSPVLPSSYYAVVVLMARMERETESFRKTYNEQWKKYAAEFDEVMANAKKII